jgi:hypothetical protein
MFYLQISNLQTIIIVPVCIADVAVFVFMSGKP